MLEYPGNILVVDDTLANLDLLSQILGGEGYEVRAARSGAAAIRSIFLAPPDLILMDMRMPGMDGVETCRQLKANPVTCNIPIIFISAADDLQSKLEAFEAGGADYVTKPFQPEEVLVRVHTHLALMSTRRQLIQSNLALAQMNQELEKRVAERTKDLNEAYLTTIYGWARTLEFHDLETKGHCERVTDIALRLGRATGIQGDELLYLERGAILHDIGKMGISANILTKPGPLTPQEFQEIKRHPVYGYELLQPIRFLQPSLDVVLYHHEKWNGCGYPSGLAGEAIPLHARLFAIIDVWDALISSRPYKKAWTYQEAHAYILEQSGQYFDPKIVAVFCSEIIPACDDKE